MPISAVVFDMDGLMLDTEPSYKVAWQRAALECGYTDDDKLTQVQDSFQQTGLAGTISSEDEILGRGLVVEIDKTSEIVDVQPR